MRGWNPATSFCGSARAASPAWPICGMRSRVRTPGACCPSWSAAMAGISGRPCPRAISHRDRPGCYTRTTMMEEKRFRDLLDAAFKRIDDAFETIDPDLAESNISQGALTIVFGQKLRFIVSPQTPV